MVKYDDREPEILAWHDRDTSPTKRILIGYLSSTKPRHLSLAAEIMENGSYCV